MDTVNIHAASDLHGGSTDQLICSRSAPTRGCLRDSKPLFSPAFPGDVSGFPLPCIFSLSASLASSQTWQAQLEFGNRLGRSGPMTEGEDLRRLGWGHPHHRSPAASSISLAFSRPELAFPRGILQSSVAGTIRSEDAELPVGSHTERSKNERQGHRQGRELQKSRAFLQNKEFLFMENISLKG